MIREVFVLSGWTDSLTTTRSSNPTHSIIIVILRVIFLIVILTDLTDKAASLTSVLLFIVMIVCIYVQAINVNNVL